jgi:DNA-binding IclR family transcriptional regulator
VIVRLSRLLPLRQAVKDQTLLDYLELVHLTPTSGRVGVVQLCQRWNCSQPSVSRRLNAVVAAGLADITPGWGNYQVHAVHHPEMT